MQARNSISLLGFLILAWLAGNSVSILDSQLMPKLSESQITSFKNAVIKMVGEIYQQTVTKKNVWGRYAPDLLDKYGTLMYANSYLGHVKEKCNADFQVDDLDLLQRYDEIDFLSLGEVYYSKYDPLSLSDRGIVHVMRLIEERMKDAKPSCVSQAEYMLREMKKMIGVTQWEDLETKTDVLPSFVQPMARFVFASIYKSPNKIPANAITVVGAGPIGLMTILLSYLKGYNVEGYEMRKYDNNFERSYKYFWKSGHAATMQRKVQTRDTMSIAATLHQLLHVQFQYPDDGIILGELQKVISNIVLLLPTRAEVLHYIEKQQLPSTYTPVLQFGYEMLGICKEGKEAVIGEMKPDFAGRPVWVSKNQKLWEKVCTETTPPSHIEVNSKREEHYLKAYHKINLENRFVVAADGAHSIVAALLNKPMKPINAISRDMQTVIPINHAIPGIVFVISGENESPKQKTEMKDSNGAFISIGARSVISSQPTWHYSDGVLSKAQIEKLKVKHAEAVSTVQQTGCAKNKEPKVCEELRDAIADGGKDVVMFPITIQVRSSAGGDEKPPQPLPYFHHDKTHYFFLGDSLSTAFFLTGSGLTFGYENLIEFSIFLDLIKTKNFGAEVTKYENMIRERVLKYTANLNYFLMRDYCGISDSVNNLWESDKLNYYNKLKELAAECAKSSS